MSQTSYSLSIPIASYPGQIADDTQVKDVVSAAAFLAAMVFGTLAVTDETNTVGFDQLACRAPSASGDVTTVGAQLGVVVANQAIPQNPAVSTPQYPQYYSVPCLRKGRIWVNAETALTDGTAPFIRFAAGGGGTVLGQFRNSADTATAVALPISQGVMRGTTAGAGYAVFEANFV